MQDTAENITVDGSIACWLKVDPRKVSGAPILKSTRVQADSIVQNYEGGESVEDIAYNFSISESGVRELLAYAASKLPTCFPLSSLQQGEPSRVTLHHCNRDKKPPKPGVVNIPFRLDKI